MRRACNEEDLEEQLTHVSDQLKVESSLDIVLHSHIANHSEFREK
jgi:hypothetical protein